MARSKPAKVDDSFKDFVLDQLRDVPGLACRAMFGGHGLYSGKAFFGILHKGELFFRTDERTRPRYEGHGSGPFRPSAKQTLKAYYQVPADVLEDRALLVQWALEAATQRA